MSNHKSPEDGSVTLDAIPISPRPSLQQGDQQEIFTVETNSLNEQDMTTRQEILDPPLDWPLNVLLTTLAKQLTEDDFKTMKTLFEGEGGIGKGLLEKMKTPTDLFRILKERGYLSRDNLLHLQAALFWTGRQDLVKQAIMHARTIGNIIHFYSPPSQPENGYRFAKFHIDGIDFQTFSREKLVKLRQTVSTLLMVPERFVIIVGVEPASSIVVTLMIPELYVEIFLELLISGEQLSDLAKADVDSVEIDKGSVFQIIASSPSKEAVSNQQVLFANVYQQLRESNTRNEITEAKLLKLYHSLEEMEMKNRQAQSVIDFLTKLLPLSKDEPDSAIPEKTTVSNILRRFCRISTDWLF